MSLARPACPASPSRSSAGSWPVWLCAVSRLFAPGPHRSTYTPACFVCAAMLAFELRMTVVAVPQTEDQARELEAMRCADRLMTSVRRLPETPALLPAALPPARHRQRGWRSALPRGVQSCAWPSTAVGQRPDPHPLMRAGAGQAVEKAGGTRLYDRMQYWMNGIEK